MITADREQQAALFFSILCVVESCRDSNELLKNITVLIVQLKYRKRFSKWLQVTVF